MHLLVLTTLACASAYEGNSTLPPYAMYGKGYVKNVARNDYVGVLTITQADRDAASSAVDWTSQTSSVKNQGGCGSCWAYATTEGVETAVFIHNNQQGAVPEFSDQQIISCDSNDGGCDGGDPMGALDYLTSVGGIDTEADYPDSSADSGQTGQCTWSGAKQPLQFEWWRAVPEGRGDQQDEEGLAAALSKYGPLTICLNANWDNHIGFHYDGVYMGLDGTCPNDVAPDHCVQLVGYDKTANPPYWKIRNSWSADWGDNGFIRIPYGSNYCGVANEAYLINVADGSGVPKAIAQSVIV